MDFSGRTVVVTGAGAGIGRATALLFARLGAAVVVNAPPGSARGSATVEQITSDGGQAALAAGEVQDPAACRHAVETAMSRFGRIDVLVNNAGLTAPGTVETATESDIDLMLTVNIKGTVFMSRAALPALRASGGVIVNVGSVAALKGHRDRAVYAASKGAVVSLTRSMAVDHVSEGVRVNCVCPGTTLTPAIEEKIRSDPDPPAAERAFERRQPLGRLGMPHEIAHAIAYAASPEAAFMTGSVVVIDGGMTM